MPSSTTRPEREGLNDQERLDNLVRGVIASALLECRDAGWVVLDESRTPVAQYHDLHDTAGAVLRRLRRAGFSVTPAEEVDSVL